MAWTIPELEMLKHPRLLRQLYSPSASHALGFSSGRLFQNGRLVASCAQEGLIRPVEKRPMLV